MINRDTDNLYFCNYDCYDNNKEWLYKFIKLFTNNITEPMNFKDFDECMEYLITQKYFVKANKEDNLIQLLNNSFGLNIENNGNLNFDKIEDYICENLKNTNNGLVYIYSPGSYYCYSIISCDTIKELKELFKPLFDNYMN